MGYPLERSASFFEIRLFRLLPGLNIDFFKKLSQVSKVAEMVAEKNVYTSGDQIRVRWPKMLRGGFWLENQDFEVSFGAICIIFRDLSVPIGPGTPNRLFRKSNCRNALCCGGVNPPGLTVGCCCEGGSPPPARNRSAAAAARSGNLYIMI